ncbi:secreted RxLR effector protein 161-like [Gastrolobium bilobum]|uniref:secreted RxLR effector protein 161-like n=1 Tax=Gastrolobium bilobum TaxID=150636 RepID=UPI002AB0754E|nr:secreted RxLR effector protein 161-like [Gastrolobium bilobum]
MDCLKSCLMVKGFTQSVDTFIDPSVKLLPNKEEPFSDFERYRRLDEKLNYLIVTQPDISFVVTVVSQFLNSPCEEHWNAIVRIIKYIKVSSGKGLEYEDKGYVKVVGYSDADWASCPTDRRYITRYYVFVEGNLVS